MAHNDENHRFIEKLNAHRNPENGQLTDPELINTLFPKVPDIIKRAEELYTFVSEGE